MRNVYNVALNNWLSNTNPIASNHPAHTYPLEISMMALFSPDGFVKIGNEIIWMSSQGFAVVPEKDRETLAELRLGNVSNLIRRKIVTNILPNPPNCRWKDNVSEIETWNNGNDKVFRYVRFFGTPWAGYAISTVSSLHRTALGFYRPHLRNLRIGLGTSAFDQDCQMQIYGNPEPLGSEKRRLFRTKTHMIWGYGFFARIKPGESNVCGYSGYGGVERTDCL